MKVNKRLLLPLISSILIATLLAIMCMALLQNSQNFPIVELDDGWKVSVNGSTTENVSLFEFYKCLDTKLLRGDRITMSHSLPDMDRIMFPAIMFRSRYTTLDCFIDNKLIYRYGNELYAKRGFVGKMYHFISLPSDFAGKELRFEMNVGENNAFSSLYPVSVGSAQDLKGKFIHEHMLIIFTSMFLIVFGVAFTCITIFFIHDIPSIRSFFVGSIFCINLGVWLSSYYNVMTVYFYTLDETQIEYFSMYLILPYLYLLVYFIQDIKNKRLYVTAGIVCTGVIIVQYILHYAFNIHMRETLPLFHLVCIASFGIILYYFFKDIKDFSPSESQTIQIIGTFVFTVAEIIHLLYYFLGNFHIHYSNYLSTVVISGGCLFFAICQLANYLLFVTQSYAQKQEYASLSHLAYADGLTNLPNRASTDKEMRELNNLTTDYCIISIDLNGLKLVNDKFGHPSGDKYITDFSKVLVSAFGDAGMCARIGGDEFLVIIRDSEGKDIDALLSRMDSALNVMNALYTEYHRSVATGHAFRHECGDGATSHEVYLLADKRMYENKRRMHEELGIKTRL